MLSILIPIYNFDVRQLVRELHTQGCLLNLPFEIICVEDASSPEFVKINQELIQLKHFKIEVLSKNVGRSKIRNHLATKANYDYLLFMDCDSMPTTSSYLLHYCKHLNPNKLLYGGRCYKEQAPSAPELYFHWYYGKNREESNSLLRKKHPYNSFMTNNFLVPKVIFDTIKFDEQLTQYGHEDTLFGLELKKQNIRILHLDNPLEHIGLEENKVFIQKSEQAIQNLYLLYQSQHIKREVKLLRYYILAKKYFLQLFILFFYKCVKNSILLNVFSSKPKLIFFDLYKLGYLIEWTKKVKNNKNK
jgi:hypothetical protein